MTVNQMQTYASRTLDRSTEARDRASYKLPWQDAIKVQPGDIHTIPEDDLLYTMMVTQASREANRIVAVEAVRLHTAQDYQGLADAGTGYANPVALPTINGVITGSITPTGSLHGVFLGASDGVIVGSMSPVGSLHGLGSPPGATGTITGSMSPTGSLTATATSPVTITTWNPSDKNANITLSSSNSVATNTAFSWHAVRAVAGKSSGKWAFRVTPTIGVTPEVNIGIGTSSAALSGGAIGTDNNAYGYAGGNGSIYKNGAILATYQAYASGQTVDVCADLDNNRLWVRRAGGNWNNSGTADPATNTGGLDISALAGTKYPIWNGYNTSDDATLDTFSPLPSGFSTWG
jgi:hypothetical protein